jgi:hypothetical protein
MHDNQLFQFTRLSAIEEFYLSYRNASRIFVCKIVKMLLRGNLHLRLKMLSRESHVCCGSYCPENLYAQSLICSYLGTFKQKFHPTSWTNSLYRIFVYAVEYEPVTSKLTAESCPMP